MSFLISEGYSEAQIELNIAGQSVDATDYIQFANDVNDEFMTQMKHATSERAYDLVLYPGLEENALPSDWMAIIEPQAPYGNHSPNFVHTTAKQFAHWPYGRVTSIRFEHENAYLIAQETSGSYGQFNECDSLTANGTWVISGDGSALAVDEEIKTQGEGSLRFLVTPSSGTTTLTCTGMNAFNMTDYLTSGRFALNLACPSTNTTAISSIQVRVGSDASNYYQMTATTRHRGDTILTSWGKVSFETATKTTTGTPDDANIDYVQIVITHGLTGVSGTYRLDDLFFTTGTYYILPYYSRNNVKSTAGVYQRKVTATDDTILCPTEMEGLYKYKILAKIAKRRLQDTGLADEFEADAMPFARTLSAKYPSQESRVTTSKYKRINTF